MFPAQTDLHDHPLYQAGHLILQDKVGQVGGKGQEADTRIVESSLGDGMGDSEVSILAMHAPHPYLPCNCSKD